MTIGDTIRKYRKENNMTQEDVAVSLGVSTPAVNKWERGVTMPDIALLSPMARLFHITTDQLLSFKSDLSDKEVGDIVQEINHSFEKEEFSSVFSRIEALVREYPSSYSLILSLSLILESQCTIKDIPDRDKYDNWIEKHAHILLESGVESIRLQGADLLFNLYMRQKRYDEAEKCLEHFSLQDPERKRKKASIYVEKGEYEEAFKALEETLFSLGQSIEATLNEIYMLEMKTGAYDKARYILGKEETLADLLDNGTYHRVSSWLDYYVARKNGDGVISIMDQLLDNTESLLSFTSSPLFEHMKFKTVDPSYFADIRKDLIDSFINEETYDFVKASPLWPDFKKKWLGSKIQ